MSTRLTRSAQSLASGAVPWKKEVAWYLIAIEAAIALLVGIYFVVSPDAANSTIRWLLGGMLIFFSALDLWNGFSGIRDQQLVNAMAPFQLLRAGAGIAIGLIIVVGARSDWLSDENARLILGTGLIAFGVIGIAGGIYAWASAGFNWVGLVANAAAVLIGAALLYNNQQNVAGETATRYLGYATIVTGAVLGLYAFYLYRHEQQHEAEEAALAAVTVPAASNAGELRPAGISPASSAPTSQSVTDANGSFTDEHRSSERIPVQEYPDTALPSADPATPPSAPRDREQS